MKENYERRESMLQMVVSVKGAITLLRAQPIGISSVIIYNPETDGKGRKVAIGTKRTF
jgi:hypothetical protein